MLSSIRIRNIALIDALELELHPGLNILTGETGAGKSIILDALSLVLGGKADTALIREGEPSASVEAYFDAPGPELTTLLEREDLLPDYGSTGLSLTRELRAEGRSTARVNGHPVSLRILQEIGAHLIDIHGQSEHLSLLRPASHIHLVDRFAADGPALEAYRTRYHRFLSLDKELKGIREGEAEALRTRDILTWQINEIRQAAVSQEEEETLLRERERLANAEKIAKLLRSALRALSGTEDRPGIIEQLADLTSALETLAPFDDTLSPLTENAIETADAMNAVHDKLRRARTELGYSTRRRDQIEERLILYAELKRKYGRTAAEVLAFAQKAEERLALIDTAAERIPALEAERAELLASLTTAARELSEARSRASRRIEADMERELKELRMPNARFTVQIISPEAGSAADPAVFGPDGFDTLQFLLAPNPGEGLKSLAKVASGGETSRIMLALKAVLAHADPVPTLIFDEIDQGVGGITGTAVGHKLAELSRSHQVICITHLPQIAAFSDRHFHVRKVTVGGRTLSGAVPLTPEQSLSELASMLGADNEENRAAAEAMRRQAARISQ